MTGEVSDNRGATSAAALASPPHISPLPPTFMALELSEDPFNSTKEDPWHTTYAELRAMRARLLTLDEVEAATSVLTKQQQALNSRTSALESNVEQNSAKIQNLGKDLNGLHKDFEKQHKQNLLQSKGMKDIGKEFAHIKDTSKDVLLLRKDLDKQVKMSQRQSKDTKEIGAEVNKVANNLDKQQKALSTNTQDLKKLQNKVSTIQINADELKTMKNQIALLQKTVAEQNRVIQKLQNPEEIQKMGEEISAIQNTMEEQKDNMSKINKLKEDFAGTSRKTVKEMNELLDTQRQQVQEFRTIRQNTQQDLQKHKDHIGTLQSFKAEVQEDTHKQIQQVSEEFSYQSLKSKAFHNRLNLVIIGLPEQQESSAFSEVLDLFKNKMKLRKRIEIREAYRMGQVRPEGSTYIRPLMVKFSKSSDRNLVWRKRNNIPTSEDDVRIRIQADLPKQLRDNLSILYRVAEAAAAMEEFRGATVKDYALLLNGQSYTARQLELLPIPIRPSSLAVKVSEEAIAFFSRFSILSNHFPSTFQIHDKTFHSMEQYLAYKRAILSKQSFFIDKALQAKDPIEAKLILNSLHNDNAQEWQDIRADVAIQGLRAKFGQNQHLRNYLCCTRDLKLGEASRNPAGGRGCC